MTKTNDLSQFSALFAWEMVTALLKNYESVHSNIKLHHFNQYLITARTAPAFSLAGSMVFLKFKSLPITFQPLFIRPSIIESSFIIIHRIWIFVNNMAAFCLDIIQE